MELAVLTTYFNPAQYRSKLANYLRFREAVLSSGTPLYAVELAFGDDGFDVPDAALQIRASAENVMWQKERLLNVLAARVPARYLAWLDADILFDSPDWPQRILDALRANTVIQVFAEAQRLPDGAWYESVCKAQTQGSMKGCMGFGWAAPADLVKEIQLYDAAILGGGDTLLALACFGRQRSDPDYSASQLTQAEIAHYLPWADRMQAAVAGRFGFADNRVRHLWHGEATNRQYIGRRQILRDAGFDPKTDIALDRSGCWRWNSPKADLHRRVREYFRSRQEDG